MDIVKIWDFWAGKYERLWVQKYSLSPTRELIISEIGKLLHTYYPENLQLLDAGCGTGQLINDIQRTFPKRLFCTGLDQSPKMVEKAVAKHIPQSSFEVGDCQIMPASTSYDIITCCHSFPYYPDKVRALREFKRVLKPGGFIYLIQAAENNLYDKTIMSIVKLTTIKGTYPSDAWVARAAKEAGLSVQEQKKLNIRGFMPSITLTVMTNREKS
ncbi:MAG: class I SAM-dependent methyltransferase [Bacillota bacterium]